MGDILIVGLIFLLLLGATSFYMYSRLMYSERKISLMENILLDIKMSMEMESEARHEHMLEVPPKVNILPDESQELKDATDYYNTVLETMAAMPDDKQVPVVTSLDEQEEDVQAKVTVNYEAMTREELAAIAEKRHLRVPKGARKNALVTLLREADNRGSNVSESGKEDVTGAGVFSSMEGSSDGAPIQSEDLSQ